MSSGRGGQPVFWKQTVNKHVKHSWYVMWISLYSLPQISYSASWTISLPPRRKWIPRPFPASWRAAGHWAGHPVHCPHTSSLINTCMTMGKRVTKLLRKNKRQKFRMTSYLGLQTRNQKRQWVGCITWAHHGKPHTELRLSTGKVATRTSAIVFRGFCVLWKHGTWA